MRLLASQSSCDGEFQVLRETVFKERGGEDYSRTPVSFSDRPWRHRHTSHCVSASFPKWYKMLGGGGG